MAARRQPCWPTRSRLGVLDRYLARTGYQAQQSDRRPPRRRANLWRAADGRGGRDYSAEGSFDDQSHHRSLQWWATTHRLVLTVGAGALAVGTLAAAKALARDRDRNHDRNRGRDYGAGTASAAPAYALDRLLRNVRTGRFERSLSGLTAVGAAITTAEIYFEHDRASFGQLA